jgi:hypothetical protein
MDARLEIGQELRGKGQLADLAADGLFLEQLPPSAEGKIVLEAQGKGGKKTLVRQFRAAAVAPVPTVPEAK